MRICWRGRLLYNAVTRARVNCLVIRCWACWDNRRKISLIPRDRRIQARDDENGRHRNAV
jgi:hypothetical protein